MTQNDEWLDVVDENDQVIGKQLRSEAYTKNTNNFRVINAFIINSQGQLWIPRRTPTKRIFPSALDMSVAGHVEHGESYDSAFERETAEETNTDVNSTGYRLLGHLTPKDGVSLFMQVYEIQSDIAPNYNKDDFSEYFWLTPKELLERIEKEPKGKDDLPKLIKKYYLS